MEKDKRPLTTLFLLSSVDGKISTGSTDNMDMDIDFPNIQGVKEGLHQYYDIEQKMYPWSLITGRTQVKIGINEKDPNSIKKKEVSFAVLDNEHLNENGVKCLCAMSDKLVLITSNNNHPAYKITEDNLSIIFQETLNLRDVLEKLKSNHGCNKLTIQTGGTINSLLLKEHLIDYVDLVISPVLIGGKDTSSIIDGKSITTKDDLTQLGILEFMQFIYLYDNYIRLRYKVINSY